MSPVPREIIFKAASWNYEDDLENNDLRIHIGGITRNNESVHVIVSGFTPFVYLELSKRVTWNRAKCEALYEYICTWMKEFAPHKFNTVAKKVLHYNRPINAMCLYFNTHEASKKFSNRINMIRGKFTVPGLASFNPGEFVVHEVNIDPIMKFTAVQKLKLAGWMKVTEAFPEGGENETIYERKFSYADIDCYAHFSDVVPYDPPEIWVTNATYVSYDIECYSSNHNSKLPDPEIPGNKVFSIGSVFGRFGVSGKYEKFLHTLGNPHDIEDVTVVRCKTEKELLIKWSEMIVEKNPDYFIGYNIMKFDWQYLIVRSSRLGVFDHFNKISKIIGEHAIDREQSWGSSAYGQQTFKYMDVNGRINLDVLIEIERNYKFPKYSLDFVSNEFLKETKDDVTPRQLFMLVKLYDDMYSLLVKAQEAGLKYRGHRKNIIQRRIRETLLLRFCSGEALEMRKRMLKAKTFSQLIDEVRNTLTTTGRYNIQDCILPIKLCEKLSIQISMEETANTTNVPMSYLHTRGQGVKVLSQVFRETIFNNYIIPYQKRIEDDEKKRYVGAIVAEANPGYYENVACFDFASLYPSSMIALNICFTTLLEDDDPTPDEQCHVLEWEDHQGCEHDKSGKSVKKEDILCQKHRYRFRKLILHPDGTREHEGIMPRMERNLLQSRKVIKKQMEKLDALIEMSEGKATPDKYVEYESYGWPRIEPGTYTPDELATMKTQSKILNARQLAVKVAANSGYGVLGAQQGSIPLIQGAASVTFTGRTLITRANKYLLERYTGDPTNNDKGCVKMVYGDTDSTMVYFKDCNVEETFDLAEEISPNISHFLKTMIMKVDEDCSVKSLTTGETWRLNKFPRKRFSELSDEDKVRVHEYDALPISLTFENLYGKYFILTKKRYCAQVVNRRGELLKNTKKGVVLARRDNCKFLRDSYQQLVDGIMAKISKNDMIQIINNRVHSLFTRQIPDTHLIIYVGVKSVLSYAKTKEIKRANGTTVKEFISKKDGNIVSTNDPLHPDLHYQSSPQVMLSLKIIRRGDEVPPNTRLEFLYLTRNTDPFATFEDNHHQGNFAEDYTYFKEMKESQYLRPNYVLYLDKQLATPVSELMNVKFSGEIVPYVPINQQFERELKKLNDLHRVQVSQIRTFTREYPYATEKILFNEMSAFSGEKDILVGWSALGIKPPKRDLSGFSVRQPPSTYVTKKLAKSVMPIPMPQVEYILDSCRQSRHGRKNCIPHGSEIERICLTIKSLSVINNMRKTHGYPGMPKENLRHPSQYTDRLRVSTKKHGATKIIFVSSVNDVPKGELGELVQAYEEQVPLTIRKNSYKYYYDIRLKNGTIVEKVPRDKIATYTRKDDNLLRNIMVYRRSYKYVVEELGRLFCPLKFVNFTPHEEMKT